MHQRVFRRTRHALVRESAQRPVHMKCPNLQENRVYAQLPVHFEHFLGLVQEDAGLGLGRRLRTRASFPRGLLSAQKDLTLREHGA